MENENLRFWRHLKKTSEVHIEINRKFMEISKDALILLDSIKDKALKTQLGTKEQYKQAIKDSIISLNSTKCSLNMAKSQVKFYEQLYTDQIKDINKTNPN